VSLWYAAMWCTCGRTNGGHDRDKGRLWRIWEFAAMVSLLQPLPDLFLATVLGTIEFAPGPLMLLGVVPGAYMGMWSLLLVPLLHFCCEANHAALPRALVKATFLGTLLFWVCEEVICSFVSLWWQKNVSVLFGSVAVYVLAAEAMLSSVVVAVGSHVVHHCPMQPPWMRFCLAAIVTLAYTGSLAIFYMLIEPRDH